MCLCEIIFFLILDGDGGKGSMLIKAKRMFDRESYPGKRLAIPVLVRDRGGLVTSKRVYVYIGDEVIGNYNISDRICSFGYELISF